MTQLNDPLNQKKSSRRNIVIIAIVLIAIAVYYITRPMTQGAAPAMPQQPSAAGMALPVAEVISQDVRIWNVFSARLSAVDSVEIRPQVSGQITDIYFEEGGHVNEGDVVLTIDPIPFEAALIQARAQLETNRSQHELARLNYDRAVELLDKNAIARKALDERKNQLDIAIHSIAMAEAQLIQAEVNLSRANIQAPISGRISRPELTIGNVVQAGPGAPLLTTIVSEETVFAEFDIDDQTYLKYIYRHSKVPGALSDIPITITIPGIPEDSFSGQLFSIDNQINAQTGTVRVRALFENPEGILLPGMYVEAHMASPETNEKIVIPKSAINVDQDRKFVYVLDENNAAVYREVHLGQSVQSHRVIIDGLELGERLVLNSFGMLRPGGRVDPQPGSIILSDAKQGS